MNRFNLGANGIRGLWITKGMPEPSQYSHALLNVRYTEYSVRYAMISGGYRKVVYE